MPAAIRSSRATQRPAELHRVPRVGGRVLEGAAREPDRAGGSMDARDVEAVHRGVEGTSLRSGRSLVHARTEEIVRWHPQTVEPKVVRRDAVITDLIDGVAAESLRKAAALLLDEEAL